MSTQEKPKPAPLTSDEEQALRKAWASIDDWVMEKADEDGECPMCHGDGDVDGAVFSAVGPVAATVVGYGIGEGLDAARLVATSTGQLLATLDAERARINGIANTFDELGTGYLARAERAESERGRLAREVDRLCDVVGTLWRQRESARAKTNGGTLRMSDVHDLLCEPGRVSVDKAQLAAVLDELERERKLAVERLALTVRLRLELDEARKELVRERAHHRLEQAERVIERADDQAEVL